MAFAMEYFFNAEKGNRNDLYRVFCFQIELC